MKKILSLILSMLMILSSAVLVGAADATVTVEIDVNNVTVEVSPVSDDGHTLKIYRLIADEAGAYTFDGVKYNKGALAYLNESDSGEFSFRFSHTSQPTGKYVAVVDNDWTSAKTFDYVCTRDLVEFYNALKEAETAAEIGSALDNANTNSLISFEKGNYFKAEADGGYSAEIKTLINEAILALGLADVPIPTLDNYLIVAPTFLKNSLSAFETILKTEFARCLNVADFVTTSAGDFDALVEENEATFGLDLTYYPENNETLVSEIHEHFVAVEKESFAYTDIANAFDEAVALAYLNVSLDKLKIIEVLDYFDEKTDPNDWLTLDRSASIDFDDTKNIDLGEAMMAEAIAGNIVDKATIESYYLSCSESVADGTGGDLGEGEGGTVIGGNTVTNGAGVGSLGGGGTKPPVEENEDPVVPADGNFADLAEAEWAKEFIVRLAKDGVLNGKGDGKFYPNDKVSREEFVKIIVEAFDMLDEDATIEFSDVASDRWSYLHIASAYEAGLINGINDELFSPSGELTREGMAVIMYRLAEKLGVELSKSEETFADADDISDFAKDAVSALYASGIINGMGDGTFAPKATVTRAQTAKIVCTLLDAIGGAKE